MKNWIIVLLVAVIGLSSCGDSSAPTIVSVRINGTEIADMATFTAAFGSIATIDAVLQDDEELLIFIAYIDTSGIGGNERLFSVGLSGKEQFVETDLDMSKIDAISNASYFGGPVPVILEVQDQYFNSSQRRIFLDVQ